MNLEVWPQKSRIMPAKTPHHIPRHHHDAGKAVAPGASKSQQPSRVSKNNFSRSSVEFEEFFMMLVVTDYPRNKRRKKKTLVGRSMQKNAQPRLTNKNVSDQLRSFPRRETDCSPMKSKIRERAPPSAFTKMVWLVRQFDQQRCAARSIPCHNPQTIKLSPAPCQRPLRNIVINTLRYTRGLAVREPPNGIKT